VEMSIMSCLIDYRSNVYMGLQLDYNVIQIFSKGKRSSHIVARQKRHREGISDIKS